MFVRVAEHTSRNPYWLGSVDTSAAAELQISSVTYFAKMMKLRTYWFGLDAEMPMICLACQNKDL